MEEIKKEEVRTGNPLKKEEVRTGNPLLDEVKAERALLDKAREEAKIQADRLEQLRSDQLLSGTAGIRTETPQISEEVIKKQQAKEFWKGSEIAKALERHG